MKKENLLLVNELCEHYQVNKSFFSDLDEFGFIEVIRIENKSFIHEDKLSVVDKVIRIQNDLNINIEGVDAVFNLLEKIDELQMELHAVKNRLRLYED